MKRYLSLRKHEQTRDNQAVQNTERKYKISINIQYLILCHGSPRQSNSLLTFACVLFSNAKKDYKSRGLIYKRHYLYSFMFHM